MTETLLNVEPSAVDVPTAVDAPSVTGEPRCVWPAEAELGEGTLWSQRERALYWVDILRKSLHRFRPEDGAQTTWQFEQEISAVAERARAPGLVISLRRGLALFDPEQPDTAPRLLHQPDAEAAGNRFNDGKCDAKGRFWGGTMDAACVAPSGSLYRFDPDGTCTRHEHGIAVSNGPTWSADGRTLYFNDTVRGTVRAYDFDPDTGTLANERTWLRFARGDGLPDGMTTDAAGRIWIAHWGGGCVSCHDPVTAAELLRVNLPARNITNCAFGDDDLCTLYITSARSMLDAAQLAAEPLNGGLFAVRVGSPGVPAAMFGG